MVVKGVTMLNHPAFKRLKVGIGIFAVIVSIVFGIWLVLLMVGCEVNFSLFDIKLSPLNYIRLIAEIVVGSLLIAALAFV